MAGGRLQLAGIQGARHVEERLRLFAEEVDVEDGLWSRQVVLGQVVVESGARRAEVGDAGRRGHAGASHRHDLLAVALPDVLHHTVKVNRLQYLSQTHRLKIAKTHTKIETRFVYNIKL